MYQIQPLLKYKNLFHAFSMVEDGNMANTILGKPVNFKTVLENRSNFLKKLKVSVEKTVCMWVKGSDDFQEVSESDCGLGVVDNNKAINTDGLITGKRGIYLFLLTADCAPVILFDPIKKVLALVHVGWKGADLKIIVKVVKTLENKYEVDPLNIVVGIGPMASKNSYIQKNPLQMGDLKWKPFLEPIGGDLYKVDLENFIKKQLLSSGVLKKNTHISGLDTVKDEGFFSHYRQKNMPLNEQGRFACVVGIK